MPARRRSATARVVVETQPGLRLHAEGERYSTLLKECERLLRSIRTKKLKLERALVESKEARSAVLEQLDPFLTRYDATTAQIRVLFEELLAPGRLSARAAKLVDKVRRTLAGLGFLGALDEEPLERRDAEDSESEGQGDPFGDEYPSPSAGDPSSQGYGRREVGSAEQRGQAKNQESLRAVFRRLVAASHPDRASDEADRERRTAAMKQATQAYERGDLARLLELEQAWQRGQGLPPAGSDEARCRELELVIRELRAQASQLQREVRGAQLSASLTPLAEPIVQAIEEAKADVEQLEALRDFVISFRDGKISLGEFVEGPEPVYMHVEEDLAAILREVFGEQASQPTRKAKRPRAKAKRRTKGE